MPGRGAERESDPEPRPDPEPPDGDRGALSVLSAFVCLRFGITADFPLTRIATPIVFSIGGAYKRREAALDEYGSIEAYGQAIYLAARDWVPEPAPPSQDGVVKTVVRPPPSVRRLVVCPR